MKSWLKFIGLSFFSDKISKEALKRGYLNIALGVVFALVFLLCGLLAADLLPFSAQYNTSTDFTAFVRNAVSDDGLNLEVKSQKIAAVRIVDTFSSEEDAAAYGLNGYNLVVDTRPADTFDDFEAYYLSNDGEQQEITLEDYATLSDVAKRNFDFKIRYTANELILTDELTAGHESYLTSINSESFSELQKKQGEISRDEYQKQVYSLYVKAYYPDLSAYESTGSAPLLRNYYFHNYLNGGAEKYLFIFNDSCVGSFETNTGTKVTFYGFYKNFSDGTTFSTAKDADNFIKSAFNATAPLSVYVYFMNLIRLLPFIILMPLILALIAFCVLRLIKSKMGKGFGGCIKIIGSYLLIGSLISAIITFICGYFVPRNSLIIATLLIFFLVLLIRTAVFLIIENISVKKSVKTETENTVTETEK
ncbi:MAG: hypothetical protein K2H30_04790 [Clostridia bacterium]|nr:hypothetical protein [Clostridia bacterium]